MNDVKVRKATLEDLPIIQKISNVLGEQSYTFDNDLSLVWANTETGEKYYREKIAGKDGICLVAETNGGIIGFTSGTTHEPDAWRLTKRVEVDNIFVDEALRGKGVGKMLIDAMKQWGKEVGAQRVIVMAFFGNTRARSFYEREGFSPQEIILQHELT